MPAKTLRYTGRDRIRVAHEPPAEMIPVDQSVYTPGAIPDGMITSIYSVVKELGEVTFTGLCNMLQWQSISKIECCEVIEILKRYGLLEESGGKITIT